ncbi:MAG: hypothetical protein M1832_000103 [Thelocarpon impressellum]|nr:MAG: hypothetical protein M1832_000103 [Thelocarpon impressellum]
MTLTHRFAGIGVGDASASTTGAILLTVLQESMGRIATILFAHRLGTSLEPECKMYRLAADLFNDAAIILDCLSPAFPKVARVFILSTSSMLRALCGVAAGSSKASLSAHFAKWGNLGELNAKDSSQETIISLLGMLAGSLVVSMVSSPIAVWSWLMLLLAVHIATNRAAVRAVTMHTLNRQRANIVLSTLLADDEVISPQQAAKQERIFEWGGALRWKGTPTLASGHIGVELREMLTAPTSPDVGTRAIRGPAVELDELAQLYRDEQYLLWYEATSRKVLIALKDQASNTSQLKAWAHALLVARYFSQQQRRTADTGSGRDGAAAEPTTLAGLQVTLRSVRQVFDGYVPRLKDAGWDLDTAALETRSGSRVQFQVKGRET